MNVNELSTVLSAWLRIPKNRIQKIIKRLKKHHAFPAVNEHIYEQHMAAILIAVMAESLTIANESEGARKSVHLELEGLKDNPDGDPLDKFPRKPFMELVEKSASLVSRNGYLTFSETIAKSFLRQDVCLGKVEVEKIEVNLYGENLEGVIYVKHNDVIIPYTYTVYGTRFERSGLKQSVSIDKGTITGLGWIVKSEKILYQQS